MANAQVTYVADGILDTWAFSFAYLDTDHVKLYLDGVEDTSATFPTSSTIKASAGVPVVNTVVLIARETPRSTLLTSITNSGSIRNSDINNQSLQALYAAEEARDKLDNTMDLDSAGVYWDAHSDQIKNVTDPTADQDAATKIYVDTAEADAVAAMAASAAAAAADAVSTAADVVLTNADVVLTNADVVLTNADVVSTNADAVSTAADAVSTAADVVTAAGYAGDVVAEVANRTALAALDTATYTAAFLSESGRVGLFEWDSSDLSAAVTADTEEGVYVPLSTDATGASGCWKRIYSQLAVEHFGALSYTEAELVALDGAAAVATRAGTNSTAFQAAVDLAAYLGGEVVSCYGPIYVLDTRLNMPSAVTLEGSGVDEWEPIYPARNKQWGGTSLLFKGTGTAEVTFDSITSVRDAGGWREDPDSGGSYFKCWTAYNADASGATPATQRTFSVGITNKTDAKYWEVKDLRVVNWCGDNGIEGFSDTGSSSLGDDWDMAIVMDNTEYATLDNVQAVGGWREFGLLMCATSIANSASERNRVRRFKGQGRVGLGIRGADRREVGSTTTTTIVFPWDEEHYFSAAGGTVRGSDNVTYTYTGLTFSAPNLTLTGVTPDPTGIFHIRHAGAGFANTEVVDAYIYGLDHQSGDSAATLGLTDSRALEISGYPLRGVGFRNSKFHTAEPVIAHIHDAADIRGYGTQFEGGGHMIASASTTDSPADSPAGDTRALYLTGGDGIADQDLREFTPRSAYVQSVQNGDEDDLTGDYLIQPFRAGQDTLIKTTVGGKTALQNSSGTDVLSVSEAGVLIHAPFEPVDLATVLFAFVATPTYTHNYGWYRHISDDWWEFCVSMGWSGLDTADGSDISIQMPGCVATAMTEIKTTSVETYGWSLSGAVKAVLVGSTTYMGIGYESDGVAFDYNDEIPAAGALRIHGYYQKT